MKVRVERALPNTQHLANYSDEESKRAAESSVNKLAALTQSTRSCNKSKSNAHGQSHPLTPTSDDNTPVMDEWESDLGRSSNSDDQFPEFPSVSPSRPGELEYESRRKENILKRKALGEDLQKELEAFVVSIPKKQKNKKVSHAKSLKTSY